MRSTILAFPLFLGTALSAQIVINEVEYDQIGTDNAEYLEIKNVGETAFPMQYVRVVMINGNNGGALEYRTIEDASWAPLEPGDYFVICANQGITLNCDHQGTPLTNMIQNGPTDAIALISTVNEQIIDMVSYGGSVPGYTEGTGTDAQDTNDQDGISLCRFPDGVDTDNNNADFVLGCPTPGVANVLDPVNCDITTGILSLSEEPTFTVLPGVGGDRLLLSCEPLTAGAVGFSVFTVDGALVAERSFSTTSKATWSFPTEDHHGQLLLFRATTNTGGSVRRVLVP